MTGLLLDLSPGTQPANGPMQWAVLAFGVVTILYIAVIRPMRKGKSRPDPLERKPSKASLAQQRAIERDMGNLLVQYEEMIRRMTAQVEIRATKLEMLIQDAEKMIAGLKTATDAAKAAVPASTGSPQAGSGQAPEFPGSISSTVEQQTSPSDAAPSQSAGAVAESSLEDIRTPETRKSADGQAAGKLDDRHAEIYRLADGGRTARQIAQELSRPDGEVELILHLRSPRPRQGDLWEQSPVAATTSTMPGQAEASNSPEAPPPPGDQRRKGRKKQRSPGT